MKSALLLVLLLLGCIKNEVYTSPYKPGQLALTFNGGPSPYTGHLLNKLSEEDIKAAFFLDFEQMESHTPYTAAYSRQAKMDDHIVGIYTTEKMEQMISNNTNTNNNDNGFNEYINYIDKITNLHKELLTSPIFIHLPFKNSYDKQFVDDMEKRGFVLTTYNIDTMDYKPNSTVEEAFENIRSQMQLIVPPAKGSFITLQHDTKPFTVELATKIIDLAKQLNYELVRLDNCISSSSANNDNNYGNKAVREQLQQTKSTSSKLVVETQEVRLTICLVSIKLLVMVLTQQQQQK